MNQIAGLKNKLQKLPPDQKQEILALLSEL